MTDAKQVHTNHKTEDVSDADGVKRVVADMKQRKVPDDEIKAYEAARNVGRKKERPKKPDPVAVE